MSNRYAFLVACNDYPLVGDLYFCLADMKLLQDALVSHCDYDPAFVRSIELKSGDQMTADKLMEEISDLGKKSKPGDTLLFYFAGHGHGVNDEGYLLLPDSDLKTPEVNGISISQLTEAMRIDKRTCVRIYDACHSGLGARDSNSKRPDTAEFARAIKDEGSALEGAITLAACTGTESSYEDPALQHGYFTYALAQVLQNWEVDQSIHCGTLHDRICQSVKVLMQHRSERQTPVMYGAQAGSPSIARRIVKAEPPEAQPKLETEVSKRLILARSAASELVSARTEEVKALPQIALDLLKESEASWNIFQIVPKFSVGSSNYWPKDLVEPLVKHFEGLGLQAHHTIESYVEEPKDLMEKITGFMRIQNRKFRIQSTSWPNCVARIEWSGDEFVPSGHGGVYYIPLQTRLYVVIWGRVHSWLPDRQQLIRVYEGFAELSSDWSTLLKGPLEQLSDRLLEEVKNSVQAKLDYLDRERSK